MDFCRRVICLLLIVVITTTSCDRPVCTNNREVFDVYQPHEAPYKSELSRLIDSCGKESFGYWIAGYSKNGDREFMSVNIQNKNVCAILSLDITGYYGLEQFKKVKGGGYHSAGLKGLEYNIVQGDSTVQFILKNIEFVID